MSEEIDESRRSFLKASGLGAVAVAVAGTGLGSLFSGFFGEESSNREKKESANDRGKRSGEIVEGKPL